MFDEENFSIDMDKEFFFSTLHKIQASINDIGNFSNNLHIELKKKPDNFTKTSKLHIIKEETKECVVTKWNYSENSGIKYCKIPRFLIAEVNKLLKSSGSKYE